MEPEVANGLCVNGRCCAAGWSGGGVNTVRTDIDECAGTGDLTCDYDSNLCGWMKASDTNCTLCKRDMEAEAAHIIKFTNPFIIEFTNPFSIESYSAVRKVAQIHCIGSVGYYHCHSLFSGRLLPYGTTMAMVPTTTYAAIFRDDSVVRTGGDGDNRITMRRQRCSGPAAAARARPVKHGAMCWSTALLAHSSRWTRLP